MAVKKNFSFVLLEKLYTFLIGIYLISIIPNYLGTDLYGIYSYCIALVLLSLSVAKLGLNQFIVHLLVKYPKNIFNIVINTFILKFSLGLLVGLFVYLFLSYKILSYSVGVVSITLVLYSFEVFEFWIQSLKKNYIASILNIVTITIVLLLTLLSISLKLDINYFLIIYSLSLTLKYVLIFIYFYISNKNIKIKISKVKLKFILNRVKPLFMASIFTASFMQIDQIMIEMILGIDKVGVYSIAVNINNYLFIIPVTFFMIILPYLSTYNKKYSVEVFDRIFIVTTSVLFYVLILISIILYIQSDNVFELLLSEEFYKSIPTYQVLIVALPLVGVNLALYNYFVLINRNDVNMKSTFWGLILNISFNFIFLKYYGVIGAAYASILSYFIMVFIFYSFIFFKSKNIIFILLPFSKFVKFAKTAQLIKKDI